MRVWAAATFLALHDAVSDPVRVTGCPDPAGMKRPANGWIRSSVRGPKLYITVQVNRSDKCTAERAEKFYANALRLTGNQPEWADDVRFVIVEDGVGTVITQEGAQLALRPTSRKA